MTSVPWSVTIDADDEPPPGFGPRWMEQAGSVGGSAYGKQHSSIVGPCAQANSWQAPSRQPHSNADGPALHRSPERNCSAGTRLVNAGAARHFQRALSGSIAGTRAQGSRGSSDSKPSTASQHQQLPAQPDYGSFDDDSDDYGVNTGGRRGSRQRGSAAAITRSGRTMTVSAG